MPYRFGFKPGETHGSAMSDTDQVEIPAPDANAPETKVEGSEAAPSPAVVKADENTETVSKVQSRFDELTKHRREAERRAERAERMLEDALRRTERQEPVKAEPVSNAPKTLADFQFDEGQYQSYLFSEAEKRAVAAAERRLKEQQDQDTQARSRTQFERRESDFAKSVEDYHEVTRNRDLPISDAMAQVIASYEEGPALAYYLGKNLAVAESISRMSPLMAAAELGAIRKGLVAEREKAKEKPVSKAPPPTPKIEAVEAEVEKDPATMTDAQFAKWRRRQIAQR